VKILVRGTNWIGDAVMAVPAIRELRRVFPDAPISLLTRSWAEDIFRDSDVFDEIISFDRSGSKFRDATRQAAELRRRKFDMAVILPNSFETALVVKLAGIPKRFGYAKEGRGFLLTNAVPMPSWKNERHEIFYYLNLVAEIEREFFGLAKEPEQAQRIELFVSDERKGRAREFLETHGISTGPKLVALGVGSTNSRAKRWPAANYARLADLFAEQLNATVILVGAADETDVANEVVAAARSKPIVLTGRTGLGEAAAILSICDLLVSNDMGLAHLAPAAGTPTLVVFGPTNDRTTRPVGAEIIRREVDCAPCMLRDCPIDHRCMTAISPDAVFERAATMIR
jgi:heptosyltransferase-2